MGKLFEFHWHTNNLLYPILMALSFDGRYICTLYLKNKNPIILSFLMFSGQIFSGILTIIVLFRSNIYKKKKKENNDDKAILGIKSDNLIQHEKSKIKQSRWDILIYFSISFLDYLSFILLNHTILDNNLSLVLRMIQILFISLFVFFILKSRFYKHNLISIILIVMGLIGLTFFEFKLDLWKYFLFYIGAFFSNSLRIVLIKVLMEKWYYSPYYLLPIIGITGIACLFVSLPLFPLISLEQLSFHNAMKIPLIETFQDIYQILLFFGIFIFGLMFNLFGTLTNFHFTSCHVGIGDTLSALILLVILKRDRPVWEIIISFILNSIILIAVIIYTEILVINLCGLNKFTIREIQKRAEEKENIPPFGILIPENNDTQNITIGSSKLTNKVN